MTELDPKVITPADILTATADLRAMAASKNMSELAYFARSMLGQVLLSAASSWAALVWRKGTERPEREGDYPVRCPSGLRVWTFFEGRWSDDGIGINDGVHFWWLSGPLPSLPEATDEG